MHIFIFLGLDKCIIYAYNEICIENAYFIANTGCERTDASHSQPKINEAGGIMRAQFITAAEVAEIMGVSAAASPIRSSGR